MIDTSALREKVLDLAIRGKLVPQDPNDEPASVLLERIRAEKEQMVKDGKLKAKDIKNTTIIFKGEDNLHYEKFSDGTVKCIEDEIPFDVPDGWAWCRLGDLFKHNTGKALNSSKTEGTILTYITTSNVYWDRFELDNLKSMPFTDSEIEKCTVRKGDLLVCEGGDIGRAAIWDCDEDIRIQNHIHRLRPYDKINCKFYYYILYLYKLNGKINGNGIGLQGLSSNALHSIITPLPPINEQIKIIAKLELIFSLITDVEINKTDLTMISTIIKSKILDIAIQGKLVPQNQDDEPASVLLERIKAQKKELIKQGKIKHDKKESVIFKGDDNSYYIISGENKELLDDWDVSDIPKSWAICTLGDICDYGNCIKVNADKIKDDEWVLDLEDIEKGTGVVLKKVRNSERKSTSTKHKFFKGQVLYSKLRPYLNKVVFADDDGYCTSEILPLNLPSDILPQYVRCYMMSPTFLKYANKCSYGVKMPRLGTDDGKKAVFMFPSFEEQKRIVDAIETAFEQLDNILSSI